MNERNHKTKQNITQEKIVSFILWSNSMVLSLNVEGILPQECVRRFFRSLLCCEGLSVPEKCLAHCGCFLCTKFFWFCSFHSASVDISPSRPLWSLKMKFNRNKFKSWYFVSKIGFISMGWGQLIYTIVPGKSTWSFYWIVN